MEQRKKLHIWLIGEGEGLPIQKKAHLMRMGTIAEFLSEQGHSVIWWSSTFLHGEKRYIYDTTTEIIIKDNYHLFLLHSPVSYKKNISLKRIAYHIILADKFYAKSRVKEKPDIILCAWPTPQFAKKAVSYGKKNNVPVIIDARDMWPDIFVRAAPKCVEKLVQFVLLPFRLSCERTFRGAYGISAMIDSMLDWACNYAGRKPGNRDKTIYISNERFELKKDRRDEINKKWKNNNISPEKWNICFFSTFGSHVAIEDVIRAVSDLSKRYPDIHLIIGGGGDREKELKEIAGECINIHFLGWLTNEEMTSLMQISKCGAFSLKNTFDFRDTFNTKAIQYISEGLPILNSLSGFARTLISNERMGVSYECGNIDDCKQKILYMYNNEDIRMEMSKNAQKCYYEKFESGVVNRVLEKYLIEIYNDYHAQCDSIKGTPFELDC